MPAFRLNQAFRIAGYFRLNPPSLINGPTTQLMAEPYLPTIGRISWPAYHLSGHRSNFHTAEPQVTRFQNRTGHRGLFVLTKMVSGIILRGRDSAEPGPAPPKSLSWSLFPHTPNWPKTAPVTDCKNGRYKHLGPSRPRLPPTSLQAYSSLGDVGSPSGTAIVPQNRDI